MATKFNFDDAIATASRNHYTTNSRASVAPVVAVTRHPSVAMHSAATALMPPFDFTAGSRSSSVTSSSTFGYGSGAGAGVHPDDHETMGALLDRWSASHQQQQQQHATQQQQQQSFRAYNGAMTSAQQPMSLGGYSGAAMTMMPSMAEVEAASVDQMQRRLAQESTRLAQLDAEDAQLAAEERALTLELRDITARHRTIDAAMFAMQQEWSEVHANERALRLEPILDLSAELAHAEGCVEVLRRRVQETEHKYGLMQAQLAVVDQVEAHKAGQMAALSELDQPFKGIHERRTRIVAWVEQQAQLDVARERVAKHAAAILDQAECAIGATAMQLRQPSTAPSRVPLGPVVPALKGSRAAVQQQMQMQQQPVAPIVATNHRSMSRANAGAPSQQPQQQQLVVEQQQVQQRLGSCSSARSGVSFAVGLDGDDDESTDYADDVQQAPLPAFNPDDISGGMSFAFPSVASVLGTKRNRSEVSGAV